MWLWLRYFLIIALSGVVAKITKNYVDRRLRGRNVTPLYSAFPDIQAEQEASVDSDVE